MQEAFSKQTKEFKDKEELFVEQESKLAERDVEVQEQMIKFHKFLLENDAKQQRERKKIEEEERVLTVKNDEIELTQKECKLQEEKLVEKKQMRDQMKA